MELPHAINWNKDKATPQDLMTYYSDLTTRNTMKSIQSMLVQVGIETTLRYVDGQAFQKERGGGRKIRSGVRWRW